jgi:hypothetical protein
MSKSTISTFELFQRFPDNEAARIYFEGQRWPEGPKTYRTLTSARAAAKRIVANNNGGAA